MMRRPRLPAPLTSLMLAIILPTLLVWGTLFALLVHPADAQEGSGPAKPTGLTATATHDQVALTWDDPQDDSITGYVILRRVRVNDVGGEFSELAPDTGTAATTYTDDSVAADTTYTYRIKAINGRGVSERSRWYHVDTPAPPVPAKPTGLTGAATHDTVTLTWDDPDDGSITGYVILRRVRVNDVGGEFSELVADTGTAATTYTDDSVQANTTYTYRIKAINEHGESERSRWFHVETLELAVPSKPTGLTAEASHDRVVLAWDDPQDDSITHYSVLRRDWDPTSSFAVIEEDTGSADAAYTDAAVASERGYVYRVRAVNAHGASEGSDQARASTPPPPIVVRSSGDGQTLWSATLTAGTATLDGETLVGYSVWNQGTGALSDTAFAVGGRTVTVQVLMVAGSGAEQGLYLGLTERLEGNAALRVGTEEFNLSEAELIRGGNWIYQWSGAGLEWTEGEEVAVSIAAPEPDGSRLRGLSLEGMAELPFSPERTRYETRRQAGQQKTTVDAQVAGGTASVLTVRSDVPLAFDAGDADAGKAGHQAQLSARGQTLVVVYATAEDGSRERAYVVRVSEAAGSAAGRRSATRSTADADATLSALELDGFDLDPAFDNETYGYSASVGTNVDTVTVAATATQSRAETLITPADADPDTAGHQVRLAGAQAGGSPAITPIIVVVRSADGSALESYVVTVTRAAPPSSDASLSALSLSGIVLSPAFASDVFIYTLAVAADVEQTTVTATANDLHGDVEIAPGSEGLPGVEITPEDSDPLTPGHQVALNEGENTITVTVTARDGQTTREYVVTVNRAAMPTSDASLAELSLSGLELSPAFDPDAQSYTASAGWDVERVELVARPTDPAASVVISPADTDANTPGWQIALAAAEPEGDPAVTNIAIVVTSSDGAARQTYLVQVSRDAPVPELPETGGFVQIDAGWRDACAIRVDGTVECWQASWRDELSGTVGAPSGAFAQLVTGKADICGVRIDGSVYCPAESTLEALPEGTSAVQVHFHTYSGACRLDDDGSVTCGTLPGERLMNPPSGVRKSEPFVSVVAGTHFACALDADGHVKCWGNPGPGEMKAPTTRFKTISAGGTNVCGIKSADSTLQCWTWHFSGYGYGRNYPEPLEHDVYVDRDDEPEGQFISVDTSYGLFCAVRLGGSVVCWGSASIHGTAQTLQLLNDAPVGEYLTISIDWDMFACGLRSDRTIACWGWDNDRIAGEMPPFESPWKDSADLVGLEISAGELSPGFDRDATAYTASVANDVASVAVTPQLTNTLATYAITSDNDAEVVDGAVDLVVGANTITVVATSADTTATKTYSIVVTRGPNSP